MLINWIDLIWLVFAAFFAANMQANLRTSGGTLGPCGSLPRGHFIAMAGRASTLLSQGAGRLKGSRGIRERGELIVRANSTLAKRLDAPRRFDPENELSNEMRSIRLLVRSQCL